MVSEYGFSAECYFSVDGRRAWANELLEKITQIAHITIQPRWVGLIDFETRFPQHFGSD